MQYDVKSKTNSKIRYTTFILFSILKYKSSKFVQIKYKVF